MAYIVGIPNFVHFDPTGRTSNPLNFTSLMGVIQTFLTGYLLVVCLILEPRTLRWRKVNVSLWLWVILLLQFLLATLLQPAFHVSAPAKTDLLLSLFYVGQWVVAFMLTMVLYSRAFPGRATDLVVSLIGRASWIWVAIVWIVLPVMPAHVYGESEEAANSVRQLGGELIHPAKLATLAGVAFFYALFFFREGPRKWLACAFALLTIALTGARTAELAFIAPFLVYTLILSGNALLRWGTVFGVAFCSVVGMAFSSALMKYVTRGQSLDTVASLDDRTRVWQASWEAIRLRPILGYGYVVGAREALREHWPFTHWIPPHSHNEFIGAAMDGGFVALAAVICIYALVSWETFRDAFRGKQFFLLAVFLQLLISTVSGPILSNRFGVIGGIFLLCCIGVLGRRQGRTNASYLARQFRPFKQGVHVPVMQEQ